MHIAPFETEHFFARYEFGIPYQLCNSDCETLSVGKLLQIAGVSLDEFAEQSLGYTESHGNARLRQLVATTYDSCDPEHVLILGSPVEGIYLTARTLLEADDEVIVLTPAYDALVNLFEHIVGEARVKRWAFQATPQQWQLNLDDLRQLISPRTKLIVVNFPHNPTGFLPSRQMQLELAEIVRANGLKLFCDEMYFGLVSPGESPTPSMLDVMPSTIVLSGLSKTYGLPGLRTGWLVIRDVELRKQFLNWKFYTSICPPAPSEFLAMAALTNWQTLRDRSRELIATNLEEADTFFSRWPQLFHWRKPQAGSTALVRYNVPSVAAVSAQLATEAGVLIQSAAMLGSDDQHMRIGLGRAGFAEALGRFEHWLHQRSTVG